MSPLEQTILSIVEFLVAPSTLTLCIPFALLIYKNMLAKLPENQRALAESFMHKAVLYVEQTANGMKGQAKRSAALNVFEGLCRDAGINVSDKFADATLEALVGAMNLNAQSQITSVLPKFQ